MSDDEIENDPHEEEEGISRNFVAFFEQISDDHESESEEIEIAIDDDYTTEKFEKAYAQLYKKWEATIKANLTLSTQSKMS